VTQVLVARGFGDWPSRTVQRRRRTRCRAAVGLGIVGIPVGPHALTSRPSRDPVATPSSSPIDQFPTGAVLPRIQKPPLVEWASGNRLIIEDDYDAGIPLRPRPHRSHPGTRARYVIYAGTAADTRPRAPARLDRPRGPIGLPTLARKLWTIVAHRDRAARLRDFLACRRVLDRHLRRMRPATAHAADALSTPTRTTARPGTTGISAAAPGHLATQVSRRSAVVTRDQPKAQESSGLDRTGSRLADRPALSAYGSLNERSIIHGVALLTETVAGLRRRGRWTTHATDAQPCASWCQTPVRRRSVRG